MSGQAAVDVVVVGAGPAGCAAAATVSRLGPSVALLHGASRAEEPGRTPLRVGEGAAPGIPQLIDEIFGPETGAFDSGAHVRCPSIISRWGGSRPAVTDHMLNPLGVAWNLDRGRFDADLRAGAQRLGADLRQGAKVTTAQRDRAGWTVGSAAAAPRGASIRARVVIDASGRGARVARLQGVRKHHLDRLVALWAVWSVDRRDQGSSTYVEAVPRGWWYSVLLGAQRRMVVHLTDADLLPASLRERLELAESAVRLELIGSALGHSAAPRIAFGPNLSSARSGWLERFDGPAWLSAGDAAATFDPLSGRGITAALLTGRSAGLAAASGLIGDDAGIAANRHDEFLGRIVGDAILERTDSYRAEMRWPAERFWSRRHELPDIH